MDEQPSLTTVVKTENFGYTGETSEYFRIWIISLCLTVVTLGIYSPWAKVRKRRYLYRSIQLADSSFDYHADPIVILKGRLIAIFMFAVYVFGGYFAPGLDALVALVIFAAIPWLIVRARMFNARNTSYRNLRFRFSPVYGEAYRVIVGYGLLTAVTFGLAYPYAHYRRSRMLVDNTQFGNLEFRLADISGAFYMTYVKVWLLGAGAGVAFVVAMTMLPTNPDGAAEPGSAALALLPFLMVGAVFALITSYLGPAIAKLVFGNMSVGEHRVRCNWAIPRVMFIYFSNLVAVALTLGLAIPWATIRLQRYQYENMSVEVQGDIESIIATQSQEVSAFGEEVGEVFDIDIGL